MTSLLDVNVLVALAWADHVHHRPAHVWFSSRGPAAWATCPITEAGFVRVSSNPRAVERPLAPIDAVAQLAAMRSDAGHEFWVDDVSLTEVDDLDVARIVSHRLVTDAQLLALARRRSGRLATFDAGICALDRDGGPLVELIPAT